MDEPGREGLVSGQTTWQRASFLELFLDLVFVFALNQVSVRLVEDLRSGRRPITGLTVTLLLFLALWLLWASTVALTSRLRPDAPPVQVMVFSVMAGASVMAVAIGSGFERRALVFAAAYVGARFFRTVFMVVFGLVPKIPVPLLYPIVASGVPWILGAVVDDPRIRGGLWGLALAIDYVGFGAGFPRLAGGQIAGEHFAERLQQFMLIALGEAIFVAGRAFSTSAFRIPNAAGFGLALVGTVLLWRIYFYRAGTTLPLAIARARAPGRRSASAAGSHLLMIAGVVLGGVGAELVTVEPLPHPHARWLIATLGGPALFLAGRAPFERQVFGRISRSRLAGLLVLGLLVPAMWHLPALAAGAAAVVVLAAIAGLDTRRGHTLESRPPAPRL